MLTIDLKLLRSRAYHVSGQLVPVLLPQILLQGILYWLVSECTMGKAVMVCDGAQSWPLCRSNKAWRSAGRRLAQLREFGKFRQWEVTAGAGVFEHAKLFR